jgi:succinoglycan biosynthesis transport protein ExoP
MAVNLPSSSAIGTTPLRPIHVPTNLDAGLRSTIGPAEMIALLRRNWLWILGCAILAAIAAYAFAATLPKSYTAETLLAVAGDRVAIPQLEHALQSDGTGDPMPAVRTEMQAVGSRQLISELVDELHLDRYPEFNGALRKPSWFAIFTGKLTALLKPSTPGPALPGAVHDSVVNAVTHALGISQDGRSLVIDVTFTAQDPQLAASVANRLIVDYVSKRSERLNAADSGANTAMNGRIAEVRDDIAKLEERMQALRTSSGVVTLRAGSLGQQQVEDLATEESQAAVARSEIEANLARANAAASSGSADELASVLSSPTTSRLRESEAEAAATVGDLSAQFGPHYPGLESAQAHLQAIRSQLSSEAHRIVASLSTQLRAAQAHEADLHHQLTEARKAGATAQDVQAQLDQLQQDITTRRTLYGTLLAGAQQTAARPRSDTLPDVRVLSVATPPSQPSAPKMKLVTGFGGVTGGILGAFIAFSRSTNKPRFRNEAEIVRATGANLLANVSSSNLRVNQRNAISGGTRSEVGSIESALHRLRSFTSGFPPRTVAIIGAQAGQKAAEAALALACAAGSESRPALLIEYGGVRGDFLKSHPSIAPSQSDSSDVIREWRDAITRDAGHPVDLLIGFVQRTEPHHQTVRLENLLAEVREEYDLVVLGAPDTRDAEAMALARTCDATILVVDMSVAIPAATHAAAADLAAASRNPLSLIILSKA